MLLDPKRYRSARRGYYIRAFVVGAISIPAGLWTLMWALFMAWRWSTGETDYLGDLAVFVFLTGVSTVIALAGLFFITRDLRLAHRISLVARTASTGAPLAAEEVARVNEVSRLAATRALGLALEIDVVRTAPVAGGSYGFPSPANARGGAAMPARAGQASTGVPPTLQSPDGLALAPTQLGVPSQLGAPTASGTRPVGDAWVGRAIGNYRVDAPLAAGAMGAVYRAHHVRTGRPYALKTILRHHTSAAMRARFEREALAAGALGHPGLVAVHDYGESSDGDPYIVMDLLEGETLEARLLRQGPAPIPVAVALAIRVAGALEVAHGRGLVHRDIKPSNLFLARDGSGEERPVLVDFGLAKTLDATAASLTGTGEAVGTPLYMAPEQARGLEVDGRADLYALGAVLHEVLTGDPPFIDVSLANVYSRLLSEPPPSVRHRVPACPTILDGIVTRCLAKTPADRYASATELIAALRRVRVASDVKTAGL